MISGKYRKELIEAIRGVDDATAKSVLLDIADAVIQLDGPMFKSDPIMQTGIGNDNLIFPIGKLIEKLDIEPPKG